MKDIIEEKIILHKISFCLAYDAVSTVISGNVNTEQLRSNVESANNPISKEVVTKLENFYHSEVKELNLPW